MHNTLGMVRRHDPHTSKDAAETVRVNAWEWRVYDFAVECGRRGCTSFEAAKVLVKRFKEETGEVVNRSTIDARFKSLRMKGMLKHNGKSRVGNKNKCLVHIALPEPWTPIPTSDLDPLTQLRVRFNKHLKKLKAEHAKEKVALRAEADLWCRRYARLEKRYNQIRDW